MSSLFDSMRKIAEKVFTSREVSNPVSHPADVEIRATTLEERILDAELNGADRWILNHLQEQLTIQKHDMAFKGHTDVAERIETFQKYHR